LNSSRFCKSVKNLRKERTQNSEISVNQEKRKGMEKYERKKLGKNKAMKIMKRKSK